MGENNGMTQARTKAKDGWAVGQFWRNCKSENRFGRAPYCHTEITWRWQHVELLQNNLLRADWERTLVKREVRKRKQKRYPKEHVVHGAPLVKPEPAWGGLETDRVTTKPEGRMDRVDPEQGSRQGRLPYSRH